MKSFVFAVLFIVVIINSVIAQYNNVPQYNEEPYINQPGLMEYEKEQAIIQGQMAPPAQQTPVPNQQAPAPVQQVQPTQPPFQQVQPTQPPFQQVQPTQPIQQTPVPVQPTQPIQTLQEVQPTQTVQPTQPIQTEGQNVEQVVQEKKNEGSSHAGTLAITGVAFALIAGVGYKNYRKDSKFKLPELPVIPGITTPKEAVSNEVVVEMEVLLSETSDAEYSLAKNRAYKCMVSWTPKQSDEIILRRGDLVCVKECFNDGYTLGRNLSTKFDGVFPTCCLCRPEQNIIGSELVKNGKFTAIPKRVTSKNRQERRARRASRGVSFLSSVPGWNKSGFSALPQY